MHRGYIKLWRKIEDSGLLSDLLLFGFAVYCIMKANYKTTKTILNGESIEIQRGQFIFGRRTFSEKLNISPSRAERYLKLLKNIDFLNLCPNRRYTLVTICNYDRYQDLKTNPEPPSEPNPNQTRTNGEPMLNTSKEVKKGRRKRIKEYAPDSYEYRLSIFLWRSITKEVTAAKEPNYNQWSEEFEKMHRIDGRPWDFINKTLIAVRNNDFWKDVILSPATFREHLNQGKLDQFIPSEFRSDEELKNE